MTIHTGHPFAVPDPDPARRLRGRLGGAVTLWTAGAGADRAGLTVSSVLVALGEQPALLALLDPDADLTDRLRETGTAVVQLLAWRERDLAEMFAGTAPAPGGPFRQAAFVDTPHGPRLASAGTWAAVRLVGEREVGWSVEVEARIEHVEIAADAADAADAGDGGAAPLLHRRGRYQRG
ncbi:flavin reductase [Nocardioides sp. zg-536]|uniref:Flavin reductase n=1 Tax=Nocardioides faecalis TaxID=2803858 RepID=A0A938YCI4_9ACTN|nr:flavin reductase [Nocardioides faecalis]MBM9461344.1 flavin reductase [Nocardioides faecalis]QVI57614.1 flavin reductase [Nocardioides faecalis]